MSEDARAFEAEWLEQRLSELIGDFPAVSLCVALSGGVDSTALLAALAVRRHPRTQLRAIHVNHGLHPEAKLWAAHCKALAQSFAVPLRIVEAQVNRAPGTSLEAEARKARYALLASELDEGEALLTGHHEDDQLETLLLQLMRGAGLAGLAAMPRVATIGKGRLVRPLLDVPRSSLEAWARSRALVWIEDEMNEDERFDRVYLRRQVLPLLKERWPAAGRSVSRTARHMAEAQRLLNALALADVERAAEGDALSVKQLRTLEPDRRRNALRFWIARRGAQLPNTARLDELAGPVLDARPDSKPQVEWEGIIVQRQADLLTLSRAQP